MKGLFLGLNNLLKGFFGKIISPFFAFFFKNFRISFAILIILLLSFSALVQSIQERDPEPFLKQVGGSIFNIDKEIENNIREAESNPPQSLWDKIMIFFSVISPLYLIYAWFHITTKYIINKMMNQSEAGIIQLFWAYILMFLLRTLYILIFHIDLEHWYEFIPFYSVYLLYIHADVWLFPIAEKLKGFNNNTALQVMT